MSIGTNIRKRREELQISQTNLAKAIGIKQPTMAQIERGSKVPSLILGKELARVLQCDLEELVKE